MANLDGKVAIVTGSSRGIGRAIAERLAADGAAVAINYNRSADEARGVVAGIEAKGGKPLRFKPIAALHRRSGVSSARLTKLRGLDIVVNNAGPSPEVVGPKPVAAFTEEEFDL
jgi:3-oxoacyl-[acyl-carrier protein] reductase